MNYWIFKSEPDAYSIDNLEAEKNQTARWDGIRNYQARNNLRDKVKKGDKVFFYHSSCKQIGIAGIMEVVQEAYPDPLQFESENKYYDAKATRDNPRWVCVDVRLVEKFPALISTKTLKANAITAEISIFRHTRLSIAPISSDQWKAVERLSG